MRFSLNRITRTFRAANDGDGGDLGIAGGDNSDNLFAGGDADWADTSSAEQMFEDHADLGDLSSLNAEKMITDEDLENEELDDDSADDSDDDDDDDSDDDGDDDSDDDDDSSDKDEDDKDSDKDDDSDDDDSDSDDEANSDDDDDDGSDDDGDTDSDADVARIASESMIADFSALSKGSDALTNEFNTANSGTFSVEAFKKDNADLYKTVNDINAEYQTALVDRETELATELSEKLFDAQSAITAKQAEQASLAGTSSATAKAKLQGAVNDAIAKAGEIYSELDNTSKDANPVMIRLVNATFQTKLSAGTSHVTAFVEAVEEIALTHKLSPTGKVSKEARNKKVETKKKTAVKKRIDAAKKTPTRKSKNGSKSKKLVNSNIKKKTGDAFFKDDFVAGLGISNPDF